MYKFIEQTAGHYMTRNVTTVARELTIREANAMFERDDFNSYPVLEEFQVIGIVTKFDLLKGFAFTPNQIVPHYSELMNRSVGEVMTPDFIYVRPETRLTRVLQLMVEHRLRSIPVIASDEKLAGIIAREDILRALAETADE